MTDNVHSRRALVVGATGGLGSAIARDFLLGEYDLIVTGTNDEKLENLLVELGKIDSKTSLYGCHLDVTDPESIEYTSQFVSEKFDGLDALVFCCGTNIRQPLKQLDRGTLEHILTVNFVGPVFTTQSLVESLERGDNPVIINLCSIFASTTYPDRLAYSASKAALLSATKTMALELAPKIRVNSISPGPILTEINKIFVQDKNAYEEFVSNIPLKRFGVEEEVAALCTFMASSKGSYMTGSDVVVDGGWLI